MSVDWKNLLKTVAPTVASALGGPLAGVATTAISNAVFGKPDAKQDEIATAIASGNTDVLLKLKEAERVFLVDMEKLGIERDRIAATDRDSARQLAVSTKSYTPEVLSWLVVLATLILEGWIMMNGIPDDVSDIVAGRILGMLDTAFATVLAFWLGTSHSSRTKDETIARLK